MWVELNDTQGVHHGFSTMDYRFNCEFCGSFVFVSSVH